MLRDRRLGRIWRDRQPADRLEPFNLLHRNQMMENEPPEHTRLRRLVAGAFERGHVERLRPRVRELAAELLADVDPAGFDVIGEYAEPLPVLVIAELLGVPPSCAPRLRAGRRRSCGCTRSRPPRTSWTPRCCAAAEFADDDPRAGPASAPRDPRDDLVSDLVAAQDGDARLTEDEVVASAVLLLNAGHEASVNVFGNGLVAMLRPGSGPRPDQVADLRRGDAALRLGAAAVRAHRHRARRARWRDRRAGSADRGAARRGQPRPGGVRRRRRPSTPDRDPNPHLAFGAGRALLPGGAAGPDGAGGVAGPPAARATPTCGWSASRSREARSCCAASRRSP